MIITAIGCIVYNQKSESSSVDKDWLTPPLNLLSIKAIGVTLIVEGNLVLYHRYIIDTPIYCLCVVVPSNWILYVVITDVWKLFPYRGSNELLDVGSWISKIEKTMLNWFVKLEIRTRRKLSRTLALYNMTHWVKTNWPNASQLYWLP